MDMKSNSKPKNLLQDEEEGNPSETPKKVSLTVGGYLTQVGIEWEERGKAIYVYPSSIQAVKEILEKIPLPQPDQYIIVPLGQTSGYTVFIMITKSGVSIRVGYGRNSIPYVSALSGILEKVGKIAKELGLESRKNGKNLLE